MTAAVTSGGGEPTRRDFIVVATGAMTVAAVGGLAWPFIDQMNPDSSALALGSIQVDVSGMEAGQSITVMWRGKPVFIRYRTPEEVAAARDTPLSDLKDPVARNENLEAGAPATMENRSPAGREEFLVMIGICTHLGCVPTGEAGEFGGWFCACHGSVYDTAGRIRHGPAPRNMDIPINNFVDDTTIKIG
ncbi:MULTISPECIES: ubiquinol-cytochrome c reductase iron-sulfur subunit [Afifella]|uniref:ubiquinol-cytochrome c reductase iron-sulfur subunit n=1 Tax=Afifella TaxID=643217 RepID=UPI000FE30B6E|nr:MULTISPECIES: ubiquinol-cytochrome c reductase iron-sulfur subunit [Afifella]MCF1505683.1 ubiquinol-cytochrome c reductase iron-sulfur subunit [Afifella sp. H1R]